MNFRILEFKEVSSTNDLARELAEKGLKEVVVLAKSQTSGRGRNNRSWHSPPGGLYFSLVLRPDFDLDEYPLIGLAMALGIAKVLNEVGIEARLKWPNDVLVNGKKIAGILVESKPGYAVVGVGVNVNISGFPELEATSISIELGDVLSLRWLLGEILKKFEGIYGQISKRSPKLIDDYRELSPMIGKEVEVDLGHEVVEGRADIDDRGRLVLTMEGVRRVIEAGEVSRVRKWGEEK